jgi:hypothetical protein
MIPALVRREFGHGSGMISPNHMIFIVNIPKNASSFVSQWTSHFDWRAAMASHYENRIAEMIVILRDPLDRWISGISQYVTGYILHAKGAYDTSTGPGQEDQYINATTFINQYNATVERMLFDNLDRHDDHVWPQNEIINGILSDKRKIYYYLDDNLEQKLCQHLGISKMPGIDRNQGNKNLDQKILQMFFRERLQQKSSLRQRVVDRYKKDYQLINQVIPCH